MSTRRNASEKFTQYPTNMIYYRKQHKQLQKFHLGGLCKRRIWIHFIVICMSFIMHCQLSTLKNQNGGPRLEQIIKGQSEHTDINSFHSGQTSLPTRTLCKHKPLEDADWSYRTIGNTDQTQKVPLQHRDPHQVPVLTLVFPLTWGLSSYLEERKLSRID